MIDIQQNFLPRAFVKFNGIIYMQVSNLQNRLTSLKNCCNCSYWRPNLINNVSKEIESNDFCQYLFFETSSKLLTSSRGKMLDQLIGFEVSIVCVEKASK